MPIVTLTVRKPKSTEFKAQVLGAIHAALVEIGVNPNDRFHRVIELDEQDFQFDPTFPDVDGGASDETFQIVGVTSLAAGDYLFA